MADLSHSPNRSLGVFTLVMINVIAVDSLRNLSITAEYGLSLIVFYTLAAILFFIPSALISAELATAWPQKGGAYVWAREAFGKRASFTFVWLQWVYNLVWYPTILSFIAGTLAYLIDPTLATNKLYMAIMSIALFWLATWANCKGMQISGLISAVSAIVGVLIPMVLVISLAVFWLSKGLPSQITFTKAQLLPHINDPHHLAFFTAILFSLMGMEMSAVHANEVKNPQGSYPKALALSVILIIGSLVLSSLAIAVILPKNNLELVTGLMQTFQLFFEKQQWHGLTAVMAIAIAVGAIGGVAAWIIGPTKGLLIAAEDNTLPKAFAKTNERGVPVTLLFVQAAVVTLLCLLFLFMPTINSSYWILGDISAQLGLLFYIVLFGCAIRLRFKHREIKRPYKIPGGNLGMLVTGSLGIVTCFVVLIVSFFPPSQIIVGNIINYEIILGGGMVLLFAIPLICYQLYHRRHGHH